jgi:hypothetical protein
MVCATRLDGWPRSDVRNLIGAATFEISLTRPDTELALDLGELDP